MIGVFFHAVSAVFMIFCLMAVGFALGKGGWLTGHEKKFLSRFVINIAVPMNCITGILNNLSHDDLPRVAQYLLVPVCTILISLLISEAAAKLLRLPRNQAGVFVAMAFISNTLFIGLPLSTELFGQECVPDVMVYYMASTVFTQSVALLLVEHAGNLPADTGFSLPRLLKDIFTKPPILAILAAYFCLIAGVRPPAFFMSFAKYLSGCVTPLALIYSGFVVYEVGLRNIRFRKGIPAMLVIRLLLAPATCALLCALVGVTGLTRNVFIVESALPVVSQVTIMAGNYGADEQYAAAGTILSTLGIFLTIPFLMVVLS
ncbi:AEC family transporter [Clostridium vitabionis]|uniref:AEC family transporter n=1 Tax=Clostridium vitabionis TaxID=2784388 RepID=UPI00188A2974|nr:AEC family transporter [Clostridium vitabionis]